VVPIVGTINAVLADYEMSGGDTALLLLVYVVAPVVALAAGALKLRDGIRERSRARMLTGIVLLVAALLFWGYLATSCK
jgi:hypothetical protein